jgi:hypothetical protein
MSREKSKFFNNFVERLLFEGHMWYSGQERVLGGGI